jgi:hypothetical protein
MKKEITFYWTATAIMSLVYLFSASMYVFNHDWVVDNYMALGFPTWLIYPSATYKTLGVLAILSRRSPLLTEWAYAGFFFNGALAVTAHVMVGDGEWPMSLIALTSALVSRTYYGKVARQNKSGNMPATILPSAG